MEVGTGDLIMRADEDKNQSLRERGGDFIPFKSYVLKTMSSVYSTESQDGYVPP